jgi:hypothetical protein
MFSVKRQSATLGIASAVGLAVFAAGAWAEIRQAAAQPNILFIMSDDHATDAISAYRSHLAEVFQTPNLDRLAAQGARLTHCFCTNSICVPNY